MSIEVFESSGFIRSAKKIVRRNPKLAVEIVTTIELLADNPFDPKLNTHKLKGKLERFWSASINYDLRIVFEFMSYENQEVILLQNIGTHDDVY